MPKLKLTKKSIEELPFHKDKQIIYWDEELVGLGILVSGKKRVKSFVVQRAINGRSKRITLGTWTEFLAVGKSVDDARKEGAKLLLEMRQGHDPKEEAKEALLAKAQAKSQEITLKQALDTYIQDSRNNVSERTLDGYRIIIEKFFPHWLNKPLREIQNSDLKKAHGDIMNKVATGDSRTKYNSDIYSSKAGACSANYAMRSLRAVWKYAHSDNKNVPNWPTENLKKMWVKIPRRKRFIKADDLKPFVEAVNDYGSINEDLKDYILLLLFTGFRRDECASLRWSQIDFKAGILRLSAEDTKSGNALDLPMSNFVYELLSSRKAMGTENDFVFPANSKSGHLEEPKKAFVVIGDRCGITMNPHSLRHTFITIAAQSGITAYELKALVNHSLGDSNDVTSGYIHALNLPRAVQTVANKIEEFCGNGLKPKVKRIS